LGEGAWYRSGNKVYHRGDSETPNSYVHDPCDWIWEHSLYDCGDGTALLWAVKSQVGAMTLVWFSRIAKTDDMCDGPQFRTETFKYSDVEVLDFGGVPPWLRTILSYVPVPWYMYFLGRKKLTVNLEVVEALKNQMAVRPKNLHTMRQMAVASLREVNANPDTKLLMKVWPKQFSDLPQSCVLSAFFDRSLEDGATLTDLNLTYGRVTSQYNEAILSLDNKTSMNVSWQAKLLFGVAAAFTGYLCARVGFRHFFNTATRLAIKPTAVLHEVSEMPLDLVNAGAYDVDPYQIAWMHILGQKLFERLMMHSIPWHHCLWAPMTEELIKTLPGAAAAFGPAEFTVTVLRQHMNTLSTGADAEIEMISTAAMRLAPLTFHNWTVGKPFWKRWLAHCAYNTAVNFGTAALCWPVVGVLYWCF
jgi:hypothetical protein